MKEIKIATHNGTFHADDVFSIALLQLYCEKNNIKSVVIRTRDVLTIDGCDVAVDVGGEYSKVRNRFDHHQKVKPKPRKNGIPYASFGLVWRHFGKKLTKMKKVLMIIDKKLVTPVDAIDNGMSISKPIIKDVYDYSVAQAISSFSKAFGEGQNEKAFSVAVDFAKIIIQGEIAKAEEKIRGEKIVNDEIRRQNEPDVLLLERYSSWELPVSKCKNIKLVVFPENESTRWCIQTARDDLEVFGRDRFSFPKEWRGLTGDELISITGISDAIFCHSAGFFAVTKTKESAIDMANKAFSIQT